MSVARTIAVIVIGLLLVTTVGAAHVTTASQRTVLNADYVDEAFEEEGVYASLSDQVVAIASEQLGSAAQSGQLPPGIGSAVDVESIIDEAVTPAYVETQVESNLRGLYDYLHGRTEDVSFVVDLAPLKENVTEALAADLQDVDSAELISQSTDSISAATDFPVDPGLFARMQANQSSYRAAQTEFREQVTTAVIDRLVNETFAQASNDRLLALVIEGYDPNDYTEAEKEQMVADREAEIRNALRERIREQRGDEIDRRVEDAIAERSEDAKAAIETQTRESTTDLPANATQALVDLQFAFIDGLTGQTEYEAFTDRIDAAETQLADAAAALVGDRIDENVPDELSLLEQLDPADREDVRAQLETAATAVQRTDTAALVLPIVALLLIALVFVVTRSFAATAGTAGVATGLVGLVTFALIAIFGETLRTRVGEAVRSGGTSDFAEPIVGLVDRLLGTISTQSLVLFVIGVVLFALAVADYRGHLDGVRERIATTWNERTS